MKDIIKYDPNQDIAIKLDLDTNTITFNPAFEAALKDSDQIIKEGHQLLKTDLNQIDEDQMTKLNKAIRPISKTQTEYVKTRQNIKKALTNRDEQILAAFDEQLNAHHFNEIQDIVKQLRNLQKDFKANRAQKRWEKLKTYFDAQMDLYPELTKYAPKTLGNFEFYRLNHTDLISEAKTKKITNQTIKTLNDDLYQYHLDATRVLESPINEDHYQTILDQYANHPTTDRILKLIDAQEANQANQQKEATVAKIKQKIRDQVQSLWLQNQKVNEILQDVAQKTDLNPDIELQAGQVNLIKVLNPFQYLNDDAQLIPDLKQAIKAQIEQVLNRYQLTDQPYQWFLNYARTNLPITDKQKATYLRDLFLNVTDPKSIWYAHIQSPHDLIQLVKFITDYQKGK